MVTSWQRFRCISRFAHPATDRLRKTEKEEIWAVLQGDHPGYDKPIIYDKTNVAFQYKLLILKRNFCFDVTGGLSQPEWSPCNLNESAELRPRPSLTKFPDFLMQVVTSFRRCGARVDNGGREKLGKRRERGRIFMLNMFSCRVEQNKYLELFFMQSLINAGFLE